MQRGAHGTQVMQAACLEKLSENAHKPSWTAQPFWRLAWGLFVELLELAAAIIGLWITETKYHRGSATIGDLRRAKVEAVREGADCQNYIMMMLDHEYCFAEHDRRDAA